MDSTMCGYHGLSPLARGTRYQQPRPRHVWRFIPAGAGNTSSLFAAVHRVTVYPRWRGEHDTRPGKPKLRDGLSPLARGTLSYPPQFEPYARFIPAGAGNTKPVLDGIKPTSVYPRWRGEHVARYQPQAVQPGLSPLARGTPDSDCYCRRHFRFIPAGAGNTQESAKGLDAPAVYPRWRGEHRCPLSAAVKTCGLSPLARGTLPLVTIKLPRQRFIPAGAGNTPIPALQVTSKTVYPRWRGEHLQ